MNTLNFKKLMSGAMVASFVVACGKKPTDTVKSVPVPTNSEQAPVESQPAAAPKGDLASEKSTSTQPASSGMGELRLTEARMATINKLANVRAAVALATKELSQAQGELESAIRQGRDAQLQVRGGLLALTVGGVASYIGVKQLKGQGTLSVGELSPSGDPELIRKEILKANPDLNQPSFSAMFVQAEKDLSTQTVTTKVRVGDNVLEFKGVTKEKFLYTIRNTYAEASLTTQGKVLPFYERQAIANVHWVEYVNDVTTKRFDTISKARAAFLESETIAKIKSIQAEARGIQRGAKIRFGSSMTLFVSGVTLAIGGATSIANGGLSIIVDRVSVKDAYDKFTQMKRELEIVEASFGVAIQDALKSGVSQEDVQAVTGPVDAK